MTSIDSVTLEVPEPGAAEAFYTAAFGLDDRVRVRASHSPAAGFRGFTLSLLVAQPGDVDSLIGSAVAGGAEVLKPAKKQFWGGYSGVVRAPDGTIWKVATPAKKDTGPATRDIDAITLLLGVADMAGSRQFYTGHGLAVAKSFGSKYTEFAAAPGAIGLGLYKRSGLAKDAGVPPEGSGSHRLVIGSDAGSFTDPDGFTWAAS